MSRLGRSVLAILAVLALAACAPTAVPSSTGAGSSASDDRRPSEPCEPGAVQVGPGADALQEALDGARPGDILQLASATYAGRFRIHVAGSAEDRIVLCGGSGSVLDGGDVDGGYALHLDGASYWDVRDIAVRGGQKGIVLDGTSHSTLTDLRISDVGQEGLHLRAGSTDNLVQRVSVQRTGLTDPGFGEGVYIGSAESNWCRYTACQPDRSDRNVFEDLSVSDTTAEAVDIKEGTSDGVIRSSTLTISPRAVVDSVVNVKGSRWRIESSAVSGGADAISVHVILPPWGAENVFASTSLTPTGGGVGIDVVGAARGAANRVGCDNSVPEGVELANIACG